jgi:hypothetical protein
MGVRAQEAVAAVAEAVESLGLTVVDTTPDVGADLVFLDADDRPVAVQVKRLSTLAGGDSVRARIGWPETPGADTVRLVVVDRISREAQRVLRDARLGWLDLRGHLRLAGRGILIDADVPPLHRRPERSDAFTGKVGLEVACWLLLHPEDDPSVRRIARDLGRSPSTVSDVLKILRNQHLLDSGGRPLLPELFWETAASWPSEPIAVASLPGENRSPVNWALELGLEQIESTAGWAVTDTVAAVAYRAPIGVRSGYPPDFYVPTAVVARRAQHLLGAAPNWDTRRAVVRVAPVPMVCTQRIDLAGRNLSSERWPAVHPVFAALDLARDPARGREILETWQPPEPWRRVW